MDHKVGFRIRLGNELGLREPMASQAHEAHFQTYAKAHTGSLSKKFISQEAHRLDRLISKPA